MPSDENDARILEVLGGQVTAFESAMAATAEQVRISLEVQKGSGNGQPSEAGAELGAFAVGRIDLERFAALRSSPQALDHMTVSRIENVFATLSGLIERKQGLLRVDVAPGGSLRDTVAQALAAIGRAFGAARVFDLSRAGRFEPQEHGALTQALRFERWSRAERRRAPPLIVHVDGADLYPGGLADFLDGAVKLVLVVSGAAPPAPLVRLVSPNTFVMQTTDVEELARLAAWDGTGVAALMPDGAARFVHDPGGGPHLWQRLMVAHLSAAPRAAVGGHSVAQQADALAQLKALAVRPPEPEAPPAPAGASTVAPEAAGSPADKLAAWLLDQADLEDLG
ncbi:MAG: hypothetical protein ACYS0K_10535 [Planctomycetota bacterium]|jgi:hypothetical protein